MSKPSEPLLDHVYAPAIIRESHQYLMWYVDVKKSPWVIRHATSDDGRRWRVSPEPCLIIDQAWEHTRLFYPTVVKIDGVYMMWYGSYWKDRGNTTATGFAVSLNGLKWYKHPHNPVPCSEPQVGITLRKQPVGDAATGRFIPHLVCQPKEAAICQ